MNHLNWSRSAGAALTATLATICCPAAHAADWTGATSTDWNTGTNWVGDAVPNGTGAFINNATGNIATISANVTDIPLEIFINSGSLNHTAGSISVQNAGWPNGWVVLGGGNASGTYNIANTEVAGGTFTGFGTGSGSLTTTGEIRVGAGAWWDHATGALNINTSGTVHANSNLTIARNNGDTGTVNVDAGTVTIAGGWQNSAEIATSSSTGTVTGSLNISGGTVTLDHRLSMCMGVRSGAGTEGDPYVYGNGSNVATLTMTGGALTTDATHDDGWHGGLYMATGYDGATGGSATVNLNGGTLSGVEVSMATADGSASTGGSATINLNGGTLSTRNVYSASWNGGAKGTSTFNFNGGTLQALDNHDVPWNQFIGGDNAITHAYVKAGGAIIDTNGFNVLVGQVLEGDSVSTGGGLTKNGLSQLEITNQNTFTGAVVVNEGTLYANSGNGPTNKAFSHSSGITVNSGATLRAGSNSLFGWDGSQAKLITINGGTAVAENGDQNVGQVTLNGGTLSSVNEDGYWGSWHFGRAADKKLLVTDNSTVSAQHVSFTGGATIEVDAGKNLNFTGTIGDGGGDGPSSVIKEGRGTLTLAGTNTYTGSTTVSEGTLSLNTSTLSNTADVTIVDGATLNLGHSDEDTVQNLIVGGTPVVYPALYRASDANGGSGDGTPLDELTGTGKLYVTGPVAPGYDVWANANVGGAASNVDTDLDGVTNGVEYFMNAAAGFTSNPSVVTAGSVRTVTWTNGGNIPPAAYGSQFLVQTSPDLVNWTPVDSADPNLSNTSGSITYTITGAGSQFVRLAVTPN